MPCCATSELMKSVRISSGPIIVCVLPEPVCPYARIVELNPAARRHPIVRRDRVHVLLRLLRVKDPVERELEVAHLDDFCLLNRLFTCTSPRTPCRRRRLQPREDADRLRLGRVGLGHRRARRRRRRAASLRRRRGRRLRRSDGGGLLLWCRRRRLCRGRCRRSGCRRRCCRRRRCLRRRGRRAPLPPVPMSPAQARRMVPPRSSRSRRR